MNKLVLKASAGTGKTYRLSLEFIKEIYKGENFKNILVITFTKKATAEIRNKIIDFMESILFLKLDSNFKDKDLNNLDFNNLDFNKKDSHDEDLKNINLKEKLQIREELKNNILNLSKDLSLDDDILLKSYYHIIKNKESLNIMTIDSFINSIFKKVVAPSAKISSYENVDDSANYEYYQIILEKIFSKKDLYDEFQDFFALAPEKNIANYINVIKTVIENRWKFILINSDNSENPSIKNIQPENSKQENFILDNSSKDKININKHKREEKIKDIFKIDESSFLKSFIAIKNILLNHATSKNKEISYYLVKDFKFIADSNISDISCITPIIEEFKGIFLKKFVDMPTNGTTIRKNSEIYNEIFPEFEKIKMYIAKIIYNDEILKYEEYIFKISEKLFEIYDELKFKDKSFTFNDISTYTFIHIFNKNFNFIENNMATDEFLELLDLELNSVFIDEFQDTSVLQWKVLFGILNRANNLICVGDEKQSIYGWREGEKDLFANLEKIIANSTLPKFENVKVENLDTCYRSSPDLISLTNNIFTNISNEISNNSATETPSDAPKITWKFNSVKSIKKYDSTIHIQKFSKDEDIYLEIFNQVKDNFFNNYNDVAILARKNDDIFKISNHLNNAGIPYILNADSLVTSEEGVSDIIDLLRFIVSENYLDFLRFMSSDIIGIDNKTLKFLIINSELITEYIFSHSPESTLVLKEKIKDKSKEFNDKNFKNINDLNNFEFEYLHVIEIIKKFKNDYDLNLSPLNNFIFSIITEFGILEVYPNISDALFRFYSHICEYENLEDFIKSIDSDTYQGETSLKNTETKNKVQLMTVHKSKGLEFDTVFFLRKQPRSFPNSLNFYFNMDENFLTVKSFLFSTNKYSSVVKFLFNNEFILELERKTMEEEINNLYVALTRAKKNLFIFNEFPGDSSKNKFFYNILEPFHTKESHTKESHTKEFGSVESYDITNLNNSKNTSASDENQKLVSKIEVQKLNFKNKNNIQDINSQFELSKIMSARKLDNLLVKSSIKEDKHQILGISYNSEEKRMIGLVIHFFLENIITASSEEIDFAKTLTFQEYSSSYVSDILHLILSDNNINYLINKNPHIFSSYWDVIYPEYEIFDEDNSQTFKIDRLLIKLPKNGKKGEIYIVDYKTGDFKDEQIENYEEIIKKMLFAQQFKLQEFEFKKEFIEFNIKI